MNTDSPRGAAPPVKATPGQGFLPRGYRGRDLEQARAPFPSPSMLQGEANAPLLDLDRLDIRGLASYMGTVGGPRENWGARYPFSNHLSIITPVALLGMGSFCRSCWLLAPLPQVSIPARGDQRNPPVPGQE